MTCLPIMAVPPFVYFDMFIITTSDFVFFVILYNHKVLVCNRVIVGCGFFAEFVQNILEP